MENLKNWINKYKTELLLVLGGVISVATSFATLDVKYAVVASVVIAVVTALMAVLKDGITEGTITLISKAIFILIEALKNEENKDENIVAANKELTVDYIKEMLVAELKK